MNHNSLVKPHICRMTLNKSGLAVEKPDSQSTFEMNDRATIGPKTGKQKGIKRKITMHMKWKFK